MFVKMVKVVKQFFCIVFTCKRTENDCTTSLYVGPTCIYFALRTKTGNKQILKWKTNKFLIYTLFISVQKNDETSGTS